MPGSFAHLWPMEDLDEDHVRILLRVLDEEPALAPVWNWQQRGVVAREVSRRPRSDRGATEPAIVTNPAADPPNGMKDGGRPGGS